jgi:hypothetical protein
MPLIQTLLCLCAAALLVAACQRPETPLSPPNAERTDITPAAWMVGCFAIDRTERLRAEGAPEAIELTGRSADVREGKQRYRVALNGSDLKYGGWTPLTAKTIRVEIVTSPGAGNLTFMLQQSNVGLLGTYRAIGDVSVGSEPEVPVSLHRVPCVRAPAK